MITRSRTKPTVEGLLEWLPGENRYRWRIIVHLGRLHASAYLAADYWESDEPLLEESDALRLKLATTGGVPLLKEPIPPPVQGISDRYRSLWDAFCGNKGKYLKQQEMLYRQALLDREQFVNRLAILTETLEDRIRYRQYLHPLPYVLPLSEVNIKDDCFYYLCGGWLWSTLRDLPLDQIGILADKYLDREDSKLAASLTIVKPNSPGRDRITSEVRRAVWQRDQGKCTQCGSRERLEYDHIIPVAKGGGNTERNIELLCEVCNRAKSDSVL